MVEFKEETKRSIARQLNEFLEKAGDDLEAFAFTVSDISFVLEIQEKEHEVNNE